MKKIAAFALVTPLALTLLVPSLANAGTQTEKTQAQKMSEKAAKSYNKELKKTQKRQDKAQRKQMKDWKKAHQTRTTVSYK